MRKLTLRLLPLSAFLFIGCATIVVNARDTTPPALSVSLQTARDFDATYSNPPGEAVPEVIDSNRQFHLKVRADRKKVLLLFLAVDGESGIRSMSGTMVASFTCKARILGGDVSKNATATLRNPAVLFTPAGHGDSVTDRNFVVVELTLEDLWRRGRCTTWDAVINKNQGRLEGIEVRYSATATNNAASPLPAPGFSGTFTIEDADVDLDQ